MPDIVFTSLLGGDRREAGGRGGKAMTMSVDKPEQVRWLEGVLQRPLHPLRKGKVSDWTNRKCYEVDGNGRIIGLNLRDCRISDGSFLKGLSQLTTLDLQANNLQELPDELLALNAEIESRQSNTRLNNSINVHNNPFVKPPLEIVEQGHAAIVAWMTDFAQGEKPLNEVKVILVGEGSAGKTTLRKRLTGIDPDPHESQTHGIEIHDFEMPCGKEKILVHFWDFGGQEIMHATHQFFLTKRSLYLLVLDARTTEA